MFTVTDESELLALLDTLIEAKLPRLSEDRDLSASPLVARLAEQAAQACRDLPGYGPTRATLAARRSMEDA
jgi:hypothetical protein